MGRCPPAARIAGEPDANSAVDSGRLLEWKVASDEMARLRFEPFRLELGAGGYRSGGSIHRLKSQHPQHAIEPFAGGGDAIDDSHVEFVGRERGVVGQRACGRLP